MRRLYSLITWLLVFVAASPAWTQTSPGEGPYDAPFGPLRSVPEGLDQALVVVGAVVHGRIQAVDFQWGEEHYTRGWDIAETIVTVEVISWLCGSVGPESLRLRFFGGQIPGSDMWQMTGGGLDTFYPGEEYIFLLRRLSADSNSHVSSGDLGLLRVVEDAQGARFVVTSHDEGIVAIADAQVTLYALRGIEPSRPTSRPTPYAQAVPPQYRYSDYSLLSLENVLSAIEDACDDSDLVLDYSRTGAAAWVEHHR
jgi:hypothetical protein